MNSEKNITIIPYNKAPLNSLEYLRNYFNITISPIESYLKKDEFSSHLYILTTKPFMDAPIKKCKIIRSEDVETPIVILSEEYDEIEAVTYFEMGADDYVNLPLKNREFVSRIKALMRRAYGINKEPENVIKIGDITIYPEAYAIYKAGVQIDFKLSEIKTLIYLIHNQNKLISREDILKNIDGNLKGGSNTRVIDVYISHLRNLLGLKKSDSSVPFNIRTVIGKGFVFEKEQQEQST